MIYTIGVPGVPEFEIVRDPGKIYESFTVGQNNHSFFFGKDLKVILRLNLLTPINARDSILSEVAFTFSSKRRHGAHRGEIHELSRQVGQAFAIFD